ncbi:hypothetical protein [Paenibacillus ihumii]|uniref:hypothetical protein n=1 Tax=Paenibacillus ihumii TaxID=687436 RepID=UPI0006D8421A|nr:hypothetical protein [Paenibacillus ihumii]
MKKLLSAILSVSIIVAALTPVAAMAAPVSTTTVTIKENTVEPEWKTKIAKEAIEALAKKLSDRKFIEAVKDYLPGDKLKDAFDEAATEIANELKFIASLGDQLEEAVQNAIVQAIMSVAGGSINSSTANTIANVLVFIFL